MNVVKNVVVIWFLYYQHDDKGFFTQLSAVGDYRGHESLVIRLYMTKNKVTLLVSSMRTGKRAFDNAGFIFAGPVSGKRL